MSRTTTGYKISLGSCVVFAVGTMIGGGVFVLSGTIVDKAGPAALASYGLAGLLMLFSALSFALIASRVPSGQNGYYYVGETLGPLWYFVVQWAFYVNGFINVAFVLRSFGAYFTQYFLKGVGATLVAIVALVGLTLLNLGPADKVNRAEWILVSIKMGILGLLIVFGLIHLGNAQFTPFAPHGTGAVLEATAMLFIAYLGFNIISNMAGSVENPQRTVPLAILISIGVVILFYIGVVLALLASDIQPLGETGLGNAAQALMGAWGLTLVALAACLSTLSSGNANIIGCSEIMIRMAAEGQMPTKLGHMSRRGHPVASVLLVAIVAAILVLTGQINTIVNLSNVTALVGMVFVNLAAIQANRKPAAEERGKKFYLPGGPIIPVLGGVTCILQLFLLGWFANILGGLMLVTGLLFYLPRHKAIHPHLQTTLKERITDLDTPVQRSARTNRK